MNLRFEPCAASEESPPRKAKAPRSVRINGSQPPAHQPKPEVAEHRIFVDFENVQEIDLDLIGEIPASVILLIGKRQKQLKVPFVKQLVDHSSKVRLLDLGVAGKNALDFVLAYEVGREAVISPNACFYIVSRDKGFDALVGHLGAAGVQISRYDDFSAIPIWPVKFREAMDCEAVDPRKQLRPETTERLERIIANLSASQRCRPKKRPALLSYMKGSFKENLSKAELNELLDALLAAEIVKMDPQGNLDYPTST